MEAAGLKGLPNLGRRVVMFGGNAHQLSLAPSYIFLLGRSKLTVVGYFFALIMTFIDSFQ